MPALPTVAVIGVGSSGLPAVKNLVDAGLSVTAFDKGSRVGGNWVIGNDNDMSSAYESLHINTSRDRMQYADLPMPDDLPDYPHHAQIAAYFEQYAETFDLHRHIRFRTGVEHVAPRSGGGFDVTTDDGETRPFDAVVVANGHHWKPRWPEPAYPGSYDGEQRHAHYYRDASGLEGKRVLVVGMGNSAMDIAVEASLVTEQTFLSARTGVWIVPKYNSGRPSDQHPLVTNPRIPWRLKQKLMGVVVKMNAGDPTRYGLPEPKQGLLQAHPTISDTILSRITHGEVTPKAGIERLDGDSVLFTDGSREKVDVIIWCTGYQVAFPFFDDNFLSAPDNELPLFHRVFSPDRPGVYFVGLLQPLGAVMPLAEAQSVWIAEHLRGRYALPPEPAIRAAVREQRQEVRERYTASPRHTIQVDFDEYLLAVRKERKAGAKRAQKAGYPLPVPHVVRETEDAVA